MNGRLGLPAKRAKPRREQMGYARDSREHSAPGVYMRDGLKFSLSAWTEPIVAPLLASQFEPAQLA